MKAIKCPVCNTNMKLVQQHNRGNFYACPNSSVADPHPTLSEEQLEWPDDWSMTDEEY